MTTITQLSDPRIAEILEMAAADGRPLAVRPETVCELEDRGWLVDPFAGIAMPHPDQLSLLSLRVALPTPSQRFYRMEHERLSAWLASFGLEDIDRSAVETAIELMASQRAEISELMESQGVESSRMNARIVELSDQISRMSDANKLDNREIVNLRQQLAQLEADNANGTLKAELASAHLRIMQLQDDIAQLRTGTLSINRVMERNGAGLRTDVAEPSVAAAEVMANMTSQADETEHGGPDYWQKSLSLALSNAPDVGEWLDGIYAGRYKFRQLPRDVRWQLIASVIRILHHTENSQPRMFDFDEHAPAWMPRSVSIVSTFGNGRWQSILDKVAES